MSTTTFRYSYPVYLEREDGDYVRTHELRALIEAQEAPARI